jgi:hypothetical protein
MNFKVSDGLVPCGNYRAKFIGSEELPPNKEHPDWGIGIKFKFEITGGVSHVGAIASTICSGKYPPSSRNRLGKTLAALHGGPLDPGQNVDDKSYIGRPYLITVEATKNGGTTVGVIMPA